MFKSAWGESWDVCNPGDLLQYLIPAVGEALQAIDDPTEAAEILLGVHDERGPEGPEAISMLLHAFLSGVSTSALNDACARAVEQRGGAVVELLADAFADELDEPEVAKLIASMEAVRGSIDTDATGSKILMHALGEVVSTEGIRFLWEHYEEHLGWDGGLDQAELLLRMYEKAVRAVTDPRWISEQVFAVCDGIASAYDDTSGWVPDRLQLSRASVDTIKVLGGPVAARNAMLPAFKLAVQDATDPWRILARTFRDVTRRASDNTIRQIEDVMVRVSQEAAGTVFTTAIAAAQEAIEDPERSVELLLAAADGQRAFWLFREFQTTDEPDRTRAIEWLVDALSERDPCPDSWASPNDPPSPPLFRVLASAAMALADPTAAANLFAVIHMATPRNDSGIDLEYALRAVVEAVAALDDPAAEIAVMYQAYVTAIDDSNDPSPSVAELLGATKEAISRTDDPAVGIEVLLRGLTIQPAGGRPPIPAWIGEPKEGETGRVFLVSDD